MSHPLADDPFRGMSEDVQSQWPSETSWQELKSPPKPTQTQAKPPEKLLEGEFTEDRPRRRTSLRPSVGGKGKERSKPARQVTGEIAFSRLDAQLVR